MRTIEVNDVFSVVLIKQLICGSEIQLKFKKSAKETGIISLSVVGIVSHNLTIKKFPKILVKGMFLGILGHVKYNRIFCLLHDALSNIEIGRYVNVQELIMVNNGIIILYFKTICDQLWSKLKTIRGRCQLMRRTIQLSAIGWVHIPWHPVSLWNSKQTVRMFVQILYYTYWFKFFI